MTKSPVISARTSHVPLNMAPTRKIGSAGSKAKLHRCGSAGADPSCGVQIALARPPKHPVRSRRAAVMANALRRMGPSRVLPSPGLPARVGAQRCVQPVVDQGAAPQFYVVVGADEPQATADQVEARR